MSSLSFSSDYTPPAYVYEVKYSEGDIYEITEFEAIIGAFTSGTLGLFDADECLVKNGLSFMNYAGLGDPAWRDEFKKLLKQLPEEKKAIQEKISNYDLFSSISLYVANNVPFARVEKTTHKVIQFLQANQHTLFTLTARGADQWYSVDRPTETVRELTKRHFTGVKIDFSKSNIPEELKEIKVVINQGTPKEREVSISDGLMFVRNTSKKDFVINALKDRTYKPERIVFIDDKLTAVKEVQEAAKILQIPYIGFHYPRLAKEQTVFDPMVTNVQLDALLFEDRVVKGHEALSLAAAKREEYAALGISAERIPVEYLRNILNRIAGSPDVLEKINPDNILP